MGQGISEVAGFGAHNDAVMAVLLLVFGVDLAANGLGILA